MLFSALDIAIDANGNFVTENGDAVAYSSIDSMTRTIAWRLRTSKDEWSAFGSDIIGDLPSFVGRTNTRSNAEQMKTYVKTAITSDGFILPNDVDVDIIPVSQEELLISVRVSRIVAPDIDFDSYTFSFSFSLDSGYIVSIDSVVR